MLTIKRAWLIVLLVCPVYLANAQNRSDSVKAVIQKDTVKLRAYAERFDPRKALLYSAVLPGMGQVYNKKYWKLPLVYGGFISIGYGLNIYQTGYTKYRGELFDMLDNGSNVSASNYTEPHLRSIVDRLRRERDFMIILMAGMYVLQIIDAHVDAHLKEFDINPNLQVRFEPSFGSDTLTGRSAGLSLKIKF